jgi:hypothetical protein
MKRTLQILFITLLAASGIPLWGQATNSGDIRGTVTDQSGAVVPGVKVTVKDVTKNVTKTFITNNAGLFDTGSIVPDEYVITFSKQGFKSLVRGPIEVQVGSLGLNAQLEVGAATQRVVVTTAAPLLHTTNATQGSSFSSSKLQRLPQVGANWQSFINLLPGTSGGGSVMGVSANGSEPFSTVLTDGATVSAPQSDNLSFPMILDALSEVKVSDSLFSAQYGVGGMVYNQISKSGGSHFHGEAYDYFQNNALNAAPYSFYKVKATVPVLHYNDFGGNIGGPIIPHRMFFFFDFDDIVNHGGSGNGFITVPDAAERAGDFTGMPTIYDPTTQTIDSNGVVHRVSFAQEYGNGNKIPANLIDPVAKAIQAYYPAPNTPGIVVNGFPQANYLYHVPHSNTNRRFFGRLDYDITPKNRLTLSELWGDDPGQTLGPLCPINCYASSLESSQAQISEMRVFSASTMNEARLGFTDELDFYVPYTLGQGFPQKLGWKFAKTDEFPSINIGHMYGLGPGTNAVYKQFLFDPSDVVTLIRGRHVLHFGGEFLIERLDSTTWGNIDAGTMNFNGDYTASTQGTAGKTGVPYADFLLGYVKAWSAHDAPEYGARQKVPQLFFNDDYKLRPNLTLNIGLRWMGETGWTEVHGNQRTFDPTIINPATGKPGAMWYGVTHVNGRTSLQHPLWNIFMPRVGFAYQPVANVAIRGGFGLYTYPWSSDTYGSGEGAALSSSGNETDHTNGALPVVLLNSDGNTNYQGSAGAAINTLYVHSPLAPDSYNGQGVGYNPYHTPTANLYQWNLSVERQIGQDLAASISYVGSHGSHQPFSTDLNQVPESKLAPNDASGATNARPYPEYQSISGNKYIGISNYNSLQTSITKRMSHGLEFNFNYTWSKYLNESDSSGQGGYAGPGGFQNAYKPRQNYGPSNFDLRDMFKGQMIYDLPFGKGRAFLNHNRLLEETVGGWMTSATIVAQTGKPFTVIMANNTSYSQAGQLHPNVVGNPLLPNPSPAEWFNVAAYAAPAPATFGDSGRNTLYGPGLLNVNFALSKTFPLTHGVTFHLAADATNALNHPSFGQPDGVIGPGHDARITGVSVGGRTMQLVGKIRF